MTEDQLEKLEAFIEAKLKENYAASVGQNAFERAQSDTAVSRNSLRVAFGLEWQE